MRGSTVIRRYDIHLNDYISISYGAVRLRPVKRHGLKRAFALPARREFVPEKFHCTISTGGTDAKFSVNPLFRTSYNQVHDSLFLI